MTLADRTIAMQSAPHVRWRSRSRSRSSASHLCRHRAGAGPAAPRRRTADHPRRRDRAAAARIHPADPEGRRPGAAEHPGRHHQRPLVQRLRRRRPAHLHQCRRADGGGDAEPDHRRAGARNRPHRRRPSLAPARAARRPRRRSRSSRMMLGVGAMVAASRSGSAERRPGRHGGADARRRRRSSSSLLAYVRSQEDAADRAGVRFLNATGQSAKGMYETFKRLADQILYRGARRRSLHAVASAAGGARARAGRSGQGQPALGQEGFAGAAAAARPDARQAVRLPRSARRRRRAAIRSATTACRRAMRARSRPIASAICARAIAQIDALIQAQPHNPYFHELKGQALLEAGRPAEAIAPLRRAVQLAPEPGADPDHARPGADRHQQQGSCRRGGRAAASGARGASRNRRTPSTRSRWPMAARATSRSADLASAQAAFTARRHQDRARSSPRAPRRRFPVGSPGWVQGRRHRQLQAAKRSAQ